MRIRAGEPHPALLGCHDLGQPREHVVDGQEVAHRLGGGVVGPGTPPARRGLRHLQYPGQLVLPSQAGGGRARLVRRSMALEAAGPAQSSCAHATAQRPTVAWCFPRRRSPLRFARLLLRSDCRAKRAGADRTRSGELRRRNHGCVEWRISSHPLAAVDVDRGAVDVAGFLGAKVQDRRRQVIG